MKTKYNLNETVYFIKMPAYSSNIARAKIQKGKVSEISHQWWEFDKGNEHKLFYTMKYKDQFDSVCNSLAIAPKKVFKTKQEAEKYLCKQLMKKHNV